MHLSPPAVGKVKGQFLETVMHGSPLSWLSRHIRDVACFPPQSLEFKDPFLTLLLSVPLLHSCASLVDHHRLSLLALSLLAPCPFLSLHLLLIFLAPSYHVPRHSQIPRYILTLHELLAHTPHEHVERNSLDYAKSKLEELSR